MLTKLNLKEDLNGVEFLRDCTRALGNRDEYLNENKTPQQLIKEYKDMLTDETEDERHIFKFWNGRLPEPNE